MKTSWILVIVVAILAYFVGVKFPATGNSVLSQVGM